MLLQNLLDLSVGGAIDAIDALDVTSIAKKEEEEESREELCAICWDKPRTSGFLHADE